MPITATATHQATLTNMTIVERVYNEQDHGTFVASTRTTATASDHGNLPERHYNSRDEETSSGTTTTSSTVSSASTNTPATASIRATTTTRRRRSITADEIVGQLWMANDQHALTLVQLMQIFHLHQSASRRYQFRQVVAELTYIRNYPVFTLVLKQKYYPVLPEETTAVVVLVAE